MYLDEKYVNSFPSSKRASVNKLMTENSVTRIINRLVDVDGFIITTGQPNVDFLNDIPVDMWYSDFEFVIRGYYFSISKGDESSGLSNLIQATNFKNFQEGTEHVLTAVIMIDESDKDFPELWGQDTEDDKYKAINFYVDLNTEVDIVPPDGFDETNCKFYSLPLVKYKAQENGNWGTYVTLDSLFKFSSSSISKIDGGEISL